MTGTRWYSGGIRATFALCILAVTTAHAHPLAPSLLDVREEDEGVVVVTWKRPLTAPVDPGRPVLPATCHPIGQPIEHADDVARVSVIRLTCPQGLAGATVGIASSNPRVTDVLLRVAWLDGRTVHHVIAPSENDFRIPEAPRTLDVLGTYGRLGLDHIAGGIDHLLFLAGLQLFAPSRRVLVTMITAFTIGHALTIAAVTVAGMTLPVVPVEVAIAGTLVVLALELLRSSAARPGILQRQPALLTLGFGLLHGLGFAGALRDTGFPADDLAGALLGFNLGVETGQLIFVAAVTLVGPALARLARGHLRSLVAYAIGSYATCLVIERLLGLGGV